MGARPYRRRDTVWALAIAMALASGPAAAAGFAVGQASVSAAGSAFAGGAAAAGDASTLFSNPAGAMRLDHHEIVIGGVYVLPRIDFDERGSTLFDGSVLTGNDGGQGGFDIVVPNLFAVWNYADHLRFGVGITAPFGLITDYDITWVGRYNETTTTFQSIDVNPAFAMRLTPELSFGAGVSVQWARERLVQALDFGTICVLPAAVGGFGLSAATCAGVGLVPGLSDGAGEVEGDDIAFGYNFGLLYEVTPRTRFGFNFRSRIHHRFDADGSFSVPPGARAIIAASATPAAFTDTAAELEIDLPETASLSFYHEPRPRWAFMGDVTWTRWTRIDEVRINFVDPATPVNLLITEWGDTYRIAAGAHYQWSERLTLRSGLAFDESPIETAFRGPGIPDSDRYIVALGAGYRVRDNLTLDAAYQHLFFNDGSARRVSATASTLRGEFSIDVDIFGVGATWRF